MIGVFLNVGLSLKVRNGFSKALVTTTLAAALLLGGSLVGSARLDASGETRSISLYHVHTKESLTVTYMENGRYVPSAMKKINYLLRDWRRDKVISIDPRTVDLIWEMHEDLGSRSAIHIVCGYRTKGTNAFLKRIGRNVATHSQHSEGKAIDFFFPDVSTKSIRNLALYRQFGGVGYYRSSGGPSGFVHVDSARVRHWGPYISNSQMAGIMSEGRKLSGRRTQRGSDWAGASGTKQQSGGLLALLTGKFKGKQQAVEPVAQPASYTDVNYNRNAADLANLAAKASSVPMPKAAPAQIEDQPMQAVASNDATEQKRVPLPRQKPLAVLALAASNIRITPVSDDPVSQSDLATGQLTKKILEAGQPVVAEAADTGGITNSNGKSDFAGEVVTASTHKLPTMRMASLSPLTQDELALWNSLVNMNAATLRESTTQPGGQEVALAEDRPQEINREGKGSLPRQTYKLIDLINAND